MGDAYCNTYNIGTQIDVTVMQGARLGLGA